MKIEDIYHGGAGAGSASEQNFSESGNLATASSAILAEREKVQIKQECIRMARNGKIRDEEKFETRDKTSKEVLEEAKGYYQWIMGLD
jgi:hypothetical protein